MPIKELGFYNNIGVQVSSRDISSTRAFIPPTRISAASYCKEKSKSTRKRRNLLTRSLNTLKRWSSHIQEIYIGNTLKVNKPNNSAYIEQVRYMYRGYLTRINLERSLSMYISFSNFYYLTNTGDLEDLLQAFSETESGEI